MKKNRKILIISFVVSVCVVAILCFYIINDSNDNSTSTTTLSSGEQTTNGEDVTTYRVAFFDSAGYLLKEEQVEEYKGVEPPSDFVPDADKIFMGWDKDFSYIFSNINVRPNYLDISSDKNYVYANAVYAKPGDEVKVRVKIGGQVCIAALQININYDETLLEYVDSVNLDNGVMVNKVENESNIRLAFLSNDNATGSVDFVDIIFKVKGTTGDKAVIMYDVEDAAQINSNNDIVVADYTVKDTVIHIY